MPDTVNLTNQPYAVKISDLKVGISGVKAVYLNDKLIDSQSEFTVSENGEYKVKIISNSLLESERSITIENIDTEKPTVTSVSVSHKETGDFARSCGVMERIIASIRLN